MPTDNAIAIWKAGVAAVEPRRLVIDAVTYFRKQFEIEISAAPAIHVVGAGKAAASMALGVEEALKDQIKKFKGQVNVPEGSASNCKIIQVCFARSAGNNYPTATGVAGANEILRQLSHAEAGDFAICLISGGGSALMPSPVEGITLEDKQRITKMLSECGAAIGEMNCVRKHLSRIKGGRLAEAFRGRWMLTLIISDVIGDSLDVIASGPTSPDPTTYHEALEVLDRYALRQSAPDSIIAELLAGVRGQRLETPKYVRENIINTIIGSNAVAVSAAWKRASELNYLLTEFGSNIQGEANVAAKRLARIVKRPHPRPNCAIFGGETTVTLGPNPGKGGRNQEFVLAMLCELGIDGMQGVTILSAGTDGEDGPTDAAGAIGTIDILHRAKALSLDPRDFLARHDAYHFFEAVGGLFKTGLTGTNVMDLGVILLE